MAKLSFILIAPFLVLSISSCSDIEDSLIVAISPTPTMTQESSPTTPNQTVLNAKPGWNKNLLVEDVYYDIYVPKTYRNRSVLVLPGWNFPRTSWVENSPLVEYAEKSGYALILPEMLQTLYESSYYPETQLKWNKIPGGEFIKKRFIPAMQSKHDLLKPGYNNTLLGLSTGGRGVAMIALENPEIFVAGASLSGDFSQENTPEERLMTAVYGPYVKFSERWKGRDNPMARVSEWKMPLYLAHGTADDVVPESQSRLFYQAIVLAHGKQFPVKYHPLKGAGHDYQFWGGELPAVFDFFQTTINK